MERPKKRGERRDDTRRAIERVRRVHSEESHIHDPSGCYCERRVGFCRRATALRCNCRKRTHGAPKLVPNGCKAWGGYRPPVVARIAGKRLARAWLDRCGAIDLDDVELGFRRVRLY